MKLRLEATVVLIFTITQSAVIFKSINVNVNKNSLRAAKWHFYWLKRINFNKKY